MAPHFSGPRKPGRPLDVAKRDAILSAARHLMMEQGAAFTIDMVAARADVSKQTLYNNFAGRDELILRVVHQMVDEFVGELSPFFEADDAATGLRKFGHRYLKMLSNPQRTGFMRMMIDAAGHNESLPKMYFQSGPARLRQSLADFLTRQNDLGHLAILNADLASEQFIGMVLGTLQIRLLLGVKIKWTDADIDRRVESAVAVFLSAYRRATALATPQQLG
jgi:TetR/AcrR family transcriptional regulator, mexJK operon transcriptional repressor